MLLALGAGTPAFSIATATPATATPDRPTGGGSSYDASHRVTQATDSTGHMGEESHLFRETTNRMESRLDPKRFVRIHRSRIVNTERIKELQPWLGGEHVVVLRNGARLPLSRGYRDKLQDQLGKGY